MLVAAMHISAQVTIGSNNPPAGYAALQIDGTKQGLRLSRLTTGERDNLTASGADLAKAKGLVVYNTTTSTIEFFDGTVWRSLSKPLEFENGINRNASGQVGLGGDLIESTTISQGANLMNFTTGGGTFSVNTNVFSVNNSSVIANVNNLMIKDGTGSNDVFKITKTGTGNTINANVGSSRLDVNSGALNIAGTKTTVGGNFAYKDGTQSAGKVLTSDANGTASWGTISPSTTYKDFTINVTEGSPSGTGTDLNTSSFGAITQTLTLEQGKWLITGVLYAYTNRATNASSVYLIKMRLYDTGNATALYTTADLPESKNATGSTNDRNGGSFSAIPITCFVEVLSGTKTVRIDAVTSRTNTYLIRNYSWLNPGRGSAFKAMRVND